MIPGETIATGASSRCSECNTEVVLHVCKSAAGYYVGTTCECGPYSRESIYYDRWDVAKRALDSGCYSR